jgi:acyl-homoserine-lactone acylase
MTWLKGGAIALLGGTALVAAGLATWEPFFAHAAAAPPERAYHAEIIRDDYGVPHIYGKTDPDVAFGVAIAHAEDDFFTLQDVVAMARGRYGAIAGADGARADYVYHLIDARGTAERHYPKLPADTRALLEAYAAGLNHFAAQHPDEVKLAGLFPVNGLDIATGFALRQPFFYGLDGVVGPLVAGEDLRHEYGPDIPGFPRQSIGDGSGVTMKKDNSARPLALPMGEAAEHLGSNAWAVRPERSGGPTTLISNSHQPLRGGVAWYELVVESGEGWHFAGANFPGSPFPFLGHNEHLGWTNTVNRPDMIDVYQLELDESGKRYRLDGKWRDLESRSVTLPVKVGPLVLPVQQTVHRSVHGPVIINDRGAFAIRYGGIDRIEQLDAYYRLNKARNLDEWQAQLARMAIPSTNFVYADEAGNIAFIYNAALPNRPELDKVEANWRSILPGDRSDLIWHGSVSYDRLPKLINPSSGWIYNANNEPWTAAGAADDLDPADFSPVLGIEEKQTNRSRRAYRLLSEANLLDRENLHRIKYDTGYERTGYVAGLWNGLASLKLKGKEAEARDLLLKWDFSADGKHPADALAMLLIRDIMSAEYGNRPPPDVHENLTKAVEHLMDHFGRLDPPLGELIRLRQGDVDLPLDGGSDTLRAATTWKVDPDGRLHLVHGDSFIMWVEWQKGQPVRSQSIQPFGAATTRPESPHYTDQMQLFVDHKLKPVQFWRDDVLQNARRRYHVTNAS